MATDSDIDNSNTGPSLFQGVAVPSVYNEEYVYDKIKSKPCHHIHRKDFLSYDIKLEVLKFLPRLSLDCLQLVSSRQYHLVEKQRFMLALHAISGDIRHGIVFEYRLVNGWQRKPERVLTNVSYKI
jgi:hypothetical protein